MDPDVAAAVIGGLAGLVTATVTAVFGFYVQRWKLHRDFEHDREGIRTAFMAEDVVRKLLEHEDFTMRKFKAIQRRLGGYDDEGKEDELRRLLIRAGAVRFLGKSDTGKKKVEYWGLLSRNPDAFLTGKQRKAQRAAAETGVEPDQESDADDDAIIRAQEQKSS